MERHTVTVCNLVNTWWLVGVTLVAAFGFPPEFWEVVGTNESSFCLKMNAAWVVWTITGGGDTQTLLAGKEKIELYALSGCGDV